MTREVIERTINGARVRVTVERVSTEHVRILDYQRRRNGGRWQTVKRMLGKLAPTQQIVGNHE